MNRTWSVVLFVMAVGLLTAAVLAQESSVTGRVNLVRASGPAGSDGNADIVIWLTPLSGAKVARTDPAVRPRPKIVQKNKRFETRVLAVEVGTTVDFPNHDPFFHNVFSLFDGKRFDLGLYEAGGTRPVRFDKAGVCYIFCNIHSQMSAAVVVVDSPYFVTLPNPGEFQIGRVPPGRYQLSVWTERVAPNDLKMISRQVNVEGPTTAIGVLRLQESRQRPAAHSNKYGKAYETPVFSSPVYALP